VALAPQAVKGQFSATLASGAIPAAGGSFTFQGTGGADVGPFASTVTLSNPTLSWTNRAAASTIVRTKPLTLTWTGGNPGTNVTMTGESTGDLVQVGYTCLVPVGAAQFTVPTYILAALPSGSGGAGMQNDVPGTLTATGLDMAAAGAQVSFSVAATFQ
jgi:hypothetical protein